MLGMMISALPHSLAISAANSSAIIRFVNLILYQGVVDRAADIHIEPFEKDFQIRYRVDGALYAMKAPDVSMAPAIISRVKIMANLNIAERRVPQDGRIALTVAALLGVVNGITADWDTEKAYWAFYINGEYAMTGVSETQITEGAVYALKVSK